MASKFHHTSPAGQAAIFIAIFIAVFAKHCSSTSSSQPVSLDLVNLLPGDNTMGSFMLKNPPPNSTDEFVLQTPNCTGLIENVDVSNLNPSAWSCVSSPILVPRRHRRLPTRIPIFNTYSFSATHDDGNGNGYNISYPTQLCSYNVIGDVPSPYGYIVQNATLQSVYTSLTQLSADELYDYTVTMLQNALDQVETGIEAVVCDPPAGGARGLLTRYLPSQVSGKWVLSITGVAGTFGVAFGGLYVPIAHPGPTANFSKTDDVTLIAATTAAGFLYTFALNELRKREVTNVIEAFILTALVTAGEYILSMFQSVWRGTCTSSSIFVAEIKQFFLKCINTFFVIGDPDNLPQGVQMVAQNNPANPVNPVNPVNPANPANPANAAQQQPHQPRQEPAPPQVQLHNICN